MRLIVLTFLSFNLICSNASGQKADQITYQISNSHPEFEVNKDSIVLSGAFSGAFPFCNKIQIYRGQQKILDHTDQEFEIIGNRSNWITEHDNRNGEYLYIIRLFNAPNPDRFLIIKTTKTQTTIFGKTESSTAEIFGDIDMDGKFEIGGLREWCQAGDSKCHSTDYYRVFEVTDNFPTDKVLTDYFKKFLDKK